jgi:glycosyltransferase involved in cell wall biosynthesis
VTPKIFYFCYSHSHPNGGQKETYQHVDILNSSGFDAYAFHMQKGFRLEWFKNDTRTIDNEEFQKIYEISRDFIVLPEDLGVRILKFPGRKVIFNKNVFYGFASLGWTRPEQSPYEDPNIVSALTVSAHNQRYLQFAYPALKVHRVYGAIDQGIFAFKALAEKKLAVVSVPKMQNALRTLYHLLDSRAAKGLNKLQNLTWSVLRDRSEVEVATTLQNSLLFVFLSVEEGLPLSPLEAMSCGCLVVGYGAGPTEEYFPFHWPFAYGDILGVAQLIERICDVYPSGIDAFQSIADAGRQRAALYSRERQRNSIVTAWEDIFRGVRDGGPAT